MMWEVRQGHVLDLLRAMPDAAVHCCVTSPPYFGLRSYKTEPQVWGGEVGHQHEWGIETPHDKANPRRREDVDVSGWANRDVTVQSGGGAECSCGAWRGELGLEPTPELFVQHIVEVFREVRRTMRSDATLFLNMGDSFSSAEYGRIREDERDQFFQLPMEIRLELFKLWASYCSSSVQGNVRDLLSAILEEEIPRADQSTRQEVLPCTQ